MTPQKPTSLNGPAGLNLKPDTPRVMRVSPRVYIALGVVAVLMLVLLYVGMANRGAVVRAAVAPAPHPVMPATSAGRDIANAAKSSSIPQLSDSPKSTAAPATLTAPCSADPQTGRPYSFDPQTGQPCSEWYPSLRAASLPPAHAVSASSSYAAQPTPEAQRALTAGEREHAAMIAPTAVAAAPVTRTPVAEPPQAPAAQPAPAAPVQPKLTEKEAFLAVNQRHASQDRLPASRTAPSSPYEIRAGWGIPAVLEQSINSDLPGEIRALVMSHVYDTATGAYLLIPQGSRLIGKYDSRVTFGQDGVQVIWNRIIYPDASSLDLDGMAGMDAQGQAGLRDKVNRHYSRLIGFSALTSLFAAAVEVSQRTQQLAGVYAYPTVTQTAGASVTREMSQTGAEFSRKNMAVPPTVRIRAGERFTVRVNRDIVFDAPYRPLPAVGR